MYNLSDDVPEKVDIDHVNVSQTVINHHYIDGKIREDEAAKSNPRHRKRPIPDHPTSRVTVRYF